MRYFYLLSGLFIFAVGVLCGGLYVERLCREGEAEVGEARRRAEGRDAREAELRADVLECRLALAEVERGELLAEVEWVAATYRLLYAGTAVQSLTGERRRSGGASGRGR